jgi:hypothetical protein
MPPLWVGLQADDDRDAFLRLFDRAAESRS